MKKAAILVLIFMFLCSSCSNQQCIENYMNDEILNNKKQKMESVLFNNKSSSILIPKIYNERNFKTKIHFAKTFNQVDHDFLKEISIKDTIINYWTENDKKKFGFEEMIIEIYTENSYRLNKKYHDSVIFYRVSNPINLKNSKTTIFFINKSKGHRNNIESSVVIMKRVKGKWIFVEKVNSQAEN